MVVKALMTGGNEVPGEVLMERIPSMISAELIDTLKGLILQGYVEADKRSFYNEDDLKPVNFHINSGYIKDLREALDPQPKKKSKRVRRE